MPDVYAQSDKWAQSCMPKAACRWSTLSRWLHGLLVGGDEADLINLATLRSMTQAYYGPKNFGHFDLALQNYAHFTSPIRRYSDLIVHRGLISAHGWGDDGLTEQEIERLEQTGQHISDTERRSMMAERDTNDRYLAAYLSDRIGAEFGGRISGIAKFGVFVKLDETGADGLVPMRNLGREYFHFDREAGTLMGADTGTIISLGQRVKVKLTDAAPVTGGIGLELLELEDAEMPQGRGTGRPSRGRKSGGPRRGKPSGPARRKEAKAKRKDAKTKRKVTRQRSQKR